MQHTYSTHYAIAVKGIAWAGFKAKMNYTLNTLPTQSDIRRLTGDFQHLSDVKVREVKTVTCVSRRSVKVGE